MRRMDIGILIFPRFTALDAIGPYEVLARIPGARVLFVAETPAPVVTDRGATLVPDATFDSCPKLDVLLVPGGPGQLDQMENETLLAFLKRAAAAADTVASVCTGALLLARAGLLEGKRATTHWLAREALAEFGVIVVPDRVVDDGVMSAAGVSSGIDLALALVARMHGDQLAQAIQLGIEYDPQPPFDAGSPEKAPPEITEFMRANARQFMS
jgi:transcriptional regulator GlxA family with amidase domain